MARKPESLAQLSAILRRRSFLALSVMASIWPSVGLWRSARMSDSIDDYASALLAPFSASSAVSIGHVVLTAHPQLADARTLTTQLVARLELDSGSIEWTRPQSMKARIAEAVRQDFALGQVMNVAGWRLAQTEARLCALAAQRIGKISRS